MEIKYIQLPKKSDDRGSLSFMESNKEIPFNIKRVYYIYDLKENGIKRGEHAHQKTDQILFCINGNVRVGFDNGKEKQIIDLNSPNIGVFVPAMNWHWMQDFSEGCVILVVASEYYNESDYIRDYNNFLKIISK